MLRENTDGEKKDHALRYGQEKRGPTRGDKRKSYPGGKGKSRRGDFFKSSYNKNLPERPPSKSKAEDYAKV